MMRKCRLQADMLSNWFTVKKGSCNAMFTVFLILITYQGLGFNDFAESCGNHWPSEERMTGRKFISAIKAPTHLIPSRLQILRGRVNHGDRRALWPRCRHIGGAQESSSHVTPTYPFSQQFICKRHDLIVEK
ncbi:hypothetical protein M514_28021 [Trichuris suis]|uniref:Uncharacterized protein n=1 Tax=Trichuris suis TaxID=68888 RepID=A0A085MRF7_9BILA|nr:hypothetical protein M514_28021 [Trichuris suis]